MSMIIGLLRRIQDIGIQGRHGDEARRIRSLNLIGAIGGVSVALYGLFYAVYDIAAYWPVVLANVLCGVGYFLPLLCNRGGRVNLAMWMLAAAAWSNMTSSTLLLGSATGIQFYLIAVAALAVIVTPAGNWWLAAVATIVSVALLEQTHFAFAVPLLTPLPDAINNAIFVGATAGTMLLVALIIGYYRKIVGDAEQDLQRANARSERLLHAILPAAIADRLKDTDATEGAAIAEHYDDVTVLFADVVGFTAQAADADAGTVVARLNELFTAFDALAAKHGLEKIKTIGDAYMAAGGLPVPQADHAERSARLALDLMATAERLRGAHWPDLKLRIGLHTGPAVAGVIGRSKFAYDIWGDTVNTASRLQELAPSERILTSETTRQRLRDGFDFDGPFELLIRGKGALTSYWLLGEKTATDSAAQAGVRSPPP